MNKAQLLGYSKMKGTSKKSGKAYDGYMFHIAYTDSNVQGHAVNNIFVDSSILEEGAVPIQLGADYIFNYETNFNGYSRLASIELCS